MTEKRLDLIDTKSSLDYFDLQKIFKYDERFLKFEKKRDRLKALFNRMMEYQYEDTGEIRKAIAPETVDRLGDCINEDELNDFYEYFQLYYGRDTQKVRCIPYTEVYWCMSVIFEFCSNRISVLDEHTQQRTRRGAARRRQQRDEAIAAELGLLFMHQK